MSAGQMIKDAMKLRNMSYSKLKSLTTISLSNLNQITANRRTITPCNAIRIANALKVLTPQKILYAQSDYLLNREYNKEKTTIKPINISKLDNRKAS